MRNIHTDRSLDIDVTGNAIIMKILGKIGHYTQEKARLMQLGQDAASEGLDLIVDMRDMNSTPDIVDLFCVASDIVSLFKQSDDLRIGFIVRDKLQAALIYKLREFTHQNKRRIFWTYTEDAMNKWISNKAPRYNKKPSIRNYISRYLAL